MPSGLFISVIGRKPAQPNRAIAPLWVGAVVPAIGLTSAGVGLIAGTPS